MKAINLAIGAKTFTAALSDNQTAKEFAARLPLSIKMTEMNGNEKYHRFDTNFATNDKIVGNVEAGDLMIWSSSYLVLFYKSFDSSYSYTKIGRIDDASGLAEAVGAGDVEISFSVK
ncbi:MAG: hypothetical protein LBI57_08010 [Helicobacteraceae bacterium]|nr:hypothetical protein [Helicobacteraceae bacterium]